MSDVLGPSDIQVEEAVSAGARAYLDLIDRWANAEASCGEDEVSAAVITAALPHIREHIAQEFRDGCPNAQGTCANCMTGAARIARGEDT